MAQATSYNVAGNREDLLDVLTILEPEETPVSSMIPKSRANASFVEWQVDDLQDPDFSGIAEGADIESFANKAENRARLGNYIQIFRREWKVSDVQQLVTTAGVPSENANSAAKCMREIKRDLESAICSDQDRQAEDGVSTFKTRGLGDWIDTAGPSDVPARYRVAAGQVDSNTMINTTESTFNATIQARYEQVGQKEDLYLVAGPTLKKTITFFSRADTSSTDSTLSVTQPAEAKKLTLTVQEYDGDFGRVYILPSLFNGRTTGTGLDATVRHRGYMFNPGHLGLAVLQSENSERLENQGGGERGYCKLMASLCVKNPLGLAKFNATS
jgi:hypothetical protein